MMDLEVLNVGGFLVGLSVVVAAGRATQISLTAIRLTIAGMFLLSLAVFAATYQDDYCDDDTACRLFNEPSFLVMEYVLPGMAVGFVITWAWRRHSRSTGAIPSEGPR